MLKATFQSLVAIALAGMPITAAVPLPAVAQTRVDDAARINGAVYVPFKAYNAPQMWRDFDASVTDRDFGYADQINVNALRVWASYEYWEMAPKKFEANFDKFLEIAKKHNIRILISLFEENGEEPTEANMWANEPVNGVCVRSPGSAITHGPQSGWEAPRKFVTWFMNRYRNDDRLLAIEIYNEPRGPKGRSSVPFAQSMLKTANGMRGTVPLTIGSAGIGQYRAFLPYGLDVLQFHQNFPKNAGQMQREIVQAMMIGKEVNKPVWLTEWQRTRPTADGFGKRDIGAAERGPDLESLAPTVNAYPIGTFFWSLMVKRAYLRPQRNKGTVNGLFWPDGSVVSKQAARLIAEDPQLQVKQKPVPADWGMEREEMLAKKH